MAHEYVAGLRCGLAFVAGCCIGGVAVTTVLRWWALGGVSALLAVVLVSGCLMLPP